MITLLRNLLLALIARFIKILNRGPLLIRISPVKKDGLPSTHYKIGSTASYLLTEPKEPMGEYEEPIAKLQCEDCGSYDRLMYVEVLGRAVCMCVTCKIERLGEEPPPPKKRKKSDI